MYTTHFGFREQPFSIASNPRFFYTNPIYREAYSGIFSALRHHTSFVVLLGEPGTGKTTLIRKVTRDLPETVHIFSFHHTSLTFEEMLTSICTDLHFPVEENTDRFAKVLALQDCLWRQAQEGGSTVFFIDEAQNLSKECLDRLQILLNLGTEHRKLLSLILAGQPELEAKLAQPDLRHIQQRIEQWYRLAPLQEEEVGLFIVHRLQTVGCTRQDLFAPEAIHGIAHYSQGIPRLINVICDNALMATYATRQTTVLPAVVEEVAENLCLKATPVLTTPKTLVKQQVPHIVAWEYPDSPMNLWPQRLAWGAFVLVLLVFVFVTQDFLSLVKAPQNSALTKFSPSFPGSPTMQSPPTAHNATPATTSTKQPPPQMALPSISVDVASVPPLPQQQGKEEFITEHTALAVTLSSPSSPQTTRSQPTRQQETGILAARPMPSLATVKVIARYTPDRSEISSRRGERGQQPSPKPVTMNQQQRDEARDQLARMGIPVTEQSLLRNVEEGNGRIVELLLTAGVSPNAADSQGWTALMLAARDNHPSVVRTLLTRRAVVNAKNKMGETALMMAAIHNRPSVVRTLLYYGADINAKNNQGWTALTYAAWKGNRATVETLLDNGANAKLQDKDGRTALTYAIRQGETVAEQVRSGKLASNRVSNVAEEKIQLATRLDYGEIVTLLKHARVER
jgi:type II secretory pathway predicted ATPase ExeA